jgi:uncharacterized repeat protein (TIGR03803 family)
MAAFRIQADLVVTEYYSFGYNDEPSGLVEGADGNFYGTAAFGAPEYYDTVFRIDTNGALTVLYTFTGGDDGGGPNGYLVQAANKDFYGTTVGGGTNGGYGTVFKINTNGTLTSVYSFTGGTNGAYPEAGLVQGGDGYFYGTTGGDETNSGTVFRIDTNGALTTLYSFIDTNFGVNPCARLIQGSDGNFYGVTRYGGTNGGYGTVFKIGTNGALVSLHSFTGGGLNPLIGGDDGAYPSARVVQDSNGNFYGTAEYGGEYGGGIVFKIDAHGTLTTLYSFTGNNDGFLPFADLALGNNGLIYGTTAGGGTNSGGTVFAIDANGALTTLYSCSFYNQEPDSIILGTDSNFYLTSHGENIDGAGSVFRLSVAQAQTLNPGVIDPTNTYAGKTYSEWAGAWGQYWMSQSTTNDPLVYDFLRPPISMSAGQSGPVWFTGWQATVNNPPQTRSITDTIPGGIGLCLAIQVLVAANADCPSPTAFTPAELLASIEPTEDALTNLTCSIDGIALSGLSNVLTTPYRQETSFDVTCPSVHNFFSDFFQDDAGQPLSCYENTNETPYTVDGVVIDGVFLIIAPLSVGPHAIRYGFSYPEVGFAPDITRNITVEPVALTVFLSDQPGNLVLSWPQTPDTYSVEVSTTLDHPTWQPIDLPVVLSQGFYQMTFQTSPGADLFFRLHLN